MNKLIKLQTKKSPCTESWFMKRNQNFGGSELSSILQPRNGVTMEIAIDRKLEGFRHGGINFFFGEIFESIVCKIVFKNKKIYKIRRVPHDYLPVVISTDGVFVNGDELVMVEIKCPYRRNLYKTLPYFHQPQMLSCLDITGCDRGLFIDARIRRCSLSDLDYNKYHYNDDNLINKIPVEIGCILFYKTKRFQNQIPIDFGMANNRLLLELRTELQSGKIKKKYINLNRTRFPFSLTKKQKLNLWGFLPWKFYDYKVFTVYPDNTYLSRYEDEIWTAHKLLLERTLD